MSSYEFNINIRIHCCSICELFTRSHGPQNLLPRWITESAGKNYNFKFHIYLGKLKSFWNTFVAISKKKKQLKLIFGNEPAWIVVRSAFAFYRYEKLFKKNLKTSNFSFHIAGIIKFQNSRQPASCYGYKRLRFGRRFNGEKIICK